MNDDYTEPDRMTSLFYYLPKDGVDILFIGDSHNFCTYIPQQIFNETGISSANIATSAASIINQYWELKEAIKKQNLKMVVMETNTFDLIFDNRPNNFYLHFTSGVSNIPNYSINKLLSYIDIKKHNYGIADKLTLFDIYGFTRYKEDTQRDFTQILPQTIGLILKPEQHFNTFGYYPLSDVVNCTDLNVVYSGNKEYLDFKETLEYEYLNKIYELCKENNIELVLSRAIYFSDCDLHFIDEQLDEWAKENDVDIIDYHKAKDICMFDFETDFFDTGHFNYLGAKKATNYFIDYLKTKENYIDHRGDAKYQLWENNDFDYNRVEEETLSNIKK